MKLAQVLPIVTLAAALLGAISCATSRNKRSALAAAHGAKTQVPTWSNNDLDFFLHGTMSTEFVPERVLRAFVRTYPDLFPSSDLSHLGLIPDATFGWPVGFSRRSVPHLGGLPSVGLNCAACHAGEITASPGASPVRVLGGASQFDAEGFFGAIIVSSFRTADSANMKKFLAAYLAVDDSASAASAEALVTKAWQPQEPKITAVMKLDPFGAKEIAAGGLHEISGSDLRLSRKSLENGQDLVPLVRATLKLFHNMRAALHVPDQPPDKAPPVSGLGRNDAFGLLSAALLGAPQPFAPVKYGLIWNVENRPWVHWDGNTRSPIGRNMLASLGLGAPLLGHEAKLDFAMLQRQTDLSERIRAPRYPWAVDEAAAKRGAIHYQAKCASCHDGAEGDRRLYSPSEVGTEPQRAVLFSQLQADRLNSFLAGIETPGYQPSKEPGIRGTQKYWAASLAGVWARAPYLHNGSVRTMEQLLTPSPSRSKAFLRGSQVYDATALGYADAGSYRLDTTSPGNSNAGHNYGTDLSNAEKRELIEYLKTL